MKRIFRDIREGKIDESDEQAFVRGFTGAAGCDWAELLKSDRVLIVSEAGAGKTYECQSQQQQMWAAGNAAFYLELSELAHTDVSDMLSPEEQHRFAAWRAAQSESAIFFLDSYDELRLTLGSFRLALKRLARATEGRLGRTKIVVTSRPIPIDQQLIREILPIPTTEEPATGEAFADRVMKQAQSRETKDAVSPWRAVALLSLTDDQIREFAVSQGVTDPDALMADIRRRNAEEFARRPQDLIELCAGWREHRSIRTHRDQVASNIRVKLAARTDRRERAPLSLEKAAQGASRLALAALLTRKLTLRHSAAGDLVSTHAALDPSMLLPDWTPDELATLLERPLFGFASYGRVRFHHRSVIEYLAAERIKALITRGMSMKAAKRLLFVTTAQGDRVVKPSMRSVAAWMALADDGVLEETLQREPSTLLNFGDPASLRPNQRVQALRVFVERYGTGGWRGLQVPWVQIHRFASADLAAEIIRLWKHGIENLEVREMMLNIIEAAKIVECADIAYSVAANPDASYGERVNALSALADMADVRLDQLIDSMATDLVLWPAPLARWAVIRLFPGQLSVDRLCGLLGRLTEKPLTVGDLSGRLPRLIEMEPLTNEGLTTLRCGLEELAADGLSWAPEWPHITSKRQFLVPALAAACLRQIRQHAVDADVLRSSAIALRLTSNGYPESHSEELRQAIGELTAVYRKIAFETDDAFMQGLRPQTEPRRRFIRVGFDGPIRLTPERDTGWVMAMLADQSLAPDKRALILEAAIDLWDGKSDLQAYLSNLKPAVSGAASLEETLDARAQPVKPDPEGRKLEADIRRHQKQASRDDAKARASWVAFWQEVADHPAEMFAEDRASHTTWNLWRAMERSGENSRESGWNRLFIEHNFDKATADRLRTTLMAAWRADRPTLRSERGPNEKGTTLVKWHLGLGAITAEAEDAAWAAKLVPGEAELALRYVPLQLNGFPPWLESLATDHPSSLDAVLGSELALELAEPLVRQWHSTTLQNIGYAPAKVASIFVPRLEHWLATTLGASKPSEDKTAFAHRLAQVVRALFKHGDEKVLARLRVFAESQLATTDDDPINRIWFAVLMRLDAAAALDALEKRLANLRVDAQGDAVNWFGSLFGERHDELSIDLSESSLTPTQLLRLLRLAYQYVRPGDDVEHEGSYSPDARDYAERGRDAVLHVLLNTTGMEGWNIKLTMAADPLFAHFKDRVMTLARERAAEEADAVAVVDAHLLALKDSAELGPATRDDMFALMVDRLDDLEDLLLRDTSPRAGWASIKEEVVMRQQIARELHHAARSAYTVDQEAATADNKETDIRMRSTGSDQQAIIELKIGEKDRSAAQLRATINDQLVTKYMAPENSRSGCLLITVAGPRHWQHPDTGAKLDLAGLTAMLNEEAMQIQNRLGGELRLIAKGLDLTPRLPTERVRSKAA